MYVRLKGTIVLGVSNQKEVVYYIIYSSIQNAQCHVHASIPITAVAANWHPWRYSTHACSCSATQAKYIGKDSIAGTQYEYKYSVTIRYLPSTLPNDVSLL